MTAYAQQLPPQRAILDLDVTQWFAHFSGVAHVCFNRPTLRSALHELLHLAGLIGEFDFMLMSESGTRIEIEYLSEFCPAGGAMQALANFRMLSLVARAYDTGVPTAFRAHFRGKAPRFAPAIRNASAPAPATGRRAIRWCSMRPTWTGPSPSSIPRWRRTRCATRRGNCSSCRARSCFRRAWNRPSSICCAGKAGRRRRLAAAGPVRRPGDEPLDPAAPVAAGADLVPRWNCAPRAANRAACCATPP
jgi:hypothetical protein